MKDPFPRCPYCDSPLDVVVEANGKAHAIMGRTRLRVFVAALPMLFVLAVLMLVGIYFGLKLHGGAL